PPKKKNKKHWIASLPRARKLLSVQARGQVTLAPKHVIQPAASSLQLLLRALEHDRHVAQRARVRDELHVRRIAQLCCRSQQPVPEAIVLDAQVIQVLEGETRKPDV